MYKTAAEKLRDALQAIMTNEFLSQTIGAADPQAFQQAADATAAYYTEQERIVKPAPTYVVQHRTPGGRTFRDGLSSHFEKVAREELGDRRFRAVNPADVRMVRRVITEEVIE